MSHNWDQQFRETEWERGERLRLAGAKRTASRYCWQCAKKVEECKCPNVTHQRRPID